MTKLGIPTSVEQVRADFCMNDEEFEAKKGPRGEWTLEPVESVRLCLHRIAELEKKAFRTKEKLADAFMPTILAKSGNVTLRCESEDEAVLLAYELVKREWNATAGQAIAGPLTDLQLANVVTVEGKIKPKKKTKREPKKARRR
jgi:hypothetical protein